MSCCYTDKSGMRHTTAEPMSVLEHTCSVRISVLNKHIQPQLSQYQTGEGAVLLLKNHVTWSNEICLFGTNAAIYSSSRAAHDPWPTAVSCISVILNKVVEGKKSGGVGEIPKHSGSFVTINEALCRAKFTFDRMAFVSAPLTSHLSHIRQKYVITTVI